MAWRMRASIHEGRPLIPLATLASTRIVACGAGQGTRLNHGGFTFGEILNCEAAFTHVRLIYMNDSGETTSIGPVAIAPSAAPGPNPVDATGTLLPMRKVTFSPGQARLVMPPKSGVRPGAASWVPDLYCSDWIALPSIRRTDGGPGCLLHVRSLLASDAMLRGPGAGPYDTTQPNPVHFTGRSYETYFQPGDHMSNRTRLIKAPGMQGAGTVYAVQFHTAVPGATVQMVGDSIGQGTGSSNGYANFVLLACAATSSDRRPVHFLQSAVAGETSTDYIRAAYRDLAYCTISIACIQTWSGNDVSSQMSPGQARSAADAAWHRAERYGHDVRLRGGVPIYLSAVPQPLRCPTPALEAARLTSVRRCHVLAGRGEFILDLNGILGDERMPADYRPEFLVDHFHASDAGQRAVAAQLAPLIRSIVGY